MTLRNFPCILFFIVFLLGCNQKNNKTSSFKSNDKDSLNYYLDKSKEKSIDLKKRLYFIDKAYKKSINLPLDSLSLAIISYKSSLHYKQNQNDSTLFYDRALLKKSNEINNDYYLGRGNKNLAFHYKKTGNTDSSYYYYNQSKGYFKNLKDSNQVGRVLMSMAQIQKNQSDFIGSKETITDAIQLLTFTKNSKYLASSYSILATNHQKLLNHQDAIKYNNLAYNTTKSKKDKLIYQNNLATVFISNKEYTKAINLLRKVRYDSILKNSPKQYARVIDNLAYSQWLAGEREILPVFLEALDLRIKQSDERGQIASYLHLGEYYLKVNKLKSKYYLNNAIKLSKKLKNPRGELEALQFLMQLNSQDIIAKNRYILLNDSLYKQELKAKTQFAKYKYDDKLKQEEIETLTIDKQRKEIEISKQKAQKIITGLLAMIVVISGFFLFYYLKQRHKKEKLKEIYDTETRISRKVHDELANDVYNIMNRIQNESKTKQKAVLEQLEDVYKKTRDISYENGTINFENQSFNLELKEMLNSYQNKNISILTRGLHEKLWLEIKDHKKIVIERVLKELMTNMKKHSKASNVVITFKKDRKNLIITYVDDGVGLKKIDNFKRNGLQNAENRIQNINGTFIFDMNNKNGVKLQMSIPI